jgi:heme A synthase
VQYFTHLPVLVVGLHMAGACAVWLATLCVLATVRAPSAGRERTMVDRLTVGVMRGGDAARSTSA